MVAERSEAVDEYIGTFPEKVLARLGDVRRAIHEAVPGAGEKISYQIPTVTLDGKPVVYFSGWKHHVAVYPLPAVEAEFEEALAPHRSGKGTAKFPHNQPLPLDLIAALAKRLAEQRTTG